VDKTLQRLTLASWIRRLERGLYDQPRRNELTGQMSVPDYRRVIQAVARRDQSRMLVDGMTAANDLGLSDAVPGRIVVHTDARLRPIKLGKQIIAFGRRRQASCSGPGVRRCGWSRRCTGYAMPWPILMTASAFKPAGSYSRDVFGWRQP
jgi:hypothetical protein